MGFGITLAVHPGQGRGPGKGFPGALQNIVFVDPTPAGASRTLSLSIERLISPNAALENNIFVDPAPPGAFQKSLFVDPALPGALQYNSFLDPGPP